MLNLVGLGRQNTMIYVDPSTNQGPNYTPIHKSCCSDADGSYNCLCHCYLVENMVRKKERKKYMWRRFALRSANYHFGTLRHGNVLQLCRLYTFSLNLSVCVVVGKEKAPNLPHAQPCIFGKKKKMLCVSRYGVPCRHYASVS